MRCLALLSGISSTGGIQRLNNHLLKALAGVTTLDSVVTFGDFENHSKVISTIIKDHHLQSFLGKILINIIKDVQIREL